VQGRAQRPYEEQSPALSTPSPPPSPPPSVHTRARPQTVQLVPRVFISHTGSDREAQIFAQSVLKQALDRAGFQTFLDTDAQDLPPGCDFSERVAEAAAHSAVFVAVLVRLP
jgi:hypothetical protein